MSETSSRDNGLFLSEKIKEPCKHPKHEPPIDLCIPAGWMFVHECPSCRNKTWILPSVDVA